jgi:hypothetical protein
MFAVGRAHDCAACITADEVHHDRHREVSLCSSFTKTSQTDHEKIAALVKEYKSLIRFSDAEETPSRKKGMPLQNIDNAVHHERRAPLFERSETETVSTTSTGNENHYETPSKAEQRAYKKAMKHEKSLKKSAKNSERHILSIRQSDIDAVTTALHGNHTDTSTGTGHPLATDQDLSDVIQRNRRFVANIQEHKVYLRRSVRLARRATNSQRKSRKRGKTADVDEASMEDEAEEVVKGVLLELDIDMSSTASKRPDRRDSFCATPPARIAAVVQKLRIAIHEDLEKHENEQRSTCIRAGGFWRYVGRPVFDRMTEVARCIDWRTGRIIKEGVEEEGEVEGEDLDGVEHENGNGDGNEVGDEGERLEE